MNKAWPASLALGALLLLPEPLAAFPGRYFRFEHFLPEARQAPVLGISSILQDKQGFLWFGTTAGLARFDGYRFDVFNPPTTSSAGRSLSPAVVFPVIEDSRGALWLGTDGQGLFRFDRTQESFVQYRHDPNDPASLGADIVLAVQEDGRGNLWVGTRFQGLYRFERATQKFSRVELGPDVEAVWDLLTDRHGDIWIGTQGGGLFRLDPDSGKLANYRHDPADPRSLGSDAVWSVFEDAQGTIWAGTKGGGLNGFQAAEEGFVRFTGDAGHPRDLLSPPITAIAEDAEGRLWIGTSWDGLRVWDRATGEYLILKHDSQDADSLRDNWITSLLRDASGIMWIGTARGGIDKCPALRARFAHFKHSRFDPRSISRNEVRSLWMGSSGRLWVGFDEGLDEVDDRAGPLQRSRSEPSDRRGLGRGAVLAFGQDSLGRVWAGTEESGLYVFDPRAGRFDRLQHDPKDPGTLSHNRVNVILADRLDRGILWVGTHRGLNRLDVRTRRFRRYVRGESDPASLSGNIITAIHQDRSGSLWVGTREGLNRWDRATGRFERYMGGSGRSAGSGPNDNSINCVCEDAAGLVWVGTNSGLSRFDRAASAWDSFEPKDGLPGSIVCGILEDAGGRLWLSTNRGLARFDPRTKTFAAFGLHDGVQENSFTPGAFCRSPDGRMFFGGTNGFNIVRPEEVQPNPHIPPLAWTGFFRNGQEERAGTPYARPRSLRLSSRLESVGFEFAALCFVQPSLNRLAYKLEPRDQEWTPFETGRIVTLARLKPGDYRLRVKGANPDGVWNETGLEVGLTLFPPFWKRTWFVVLALLFIAAGAATVVRMWLRLRSAATVIGDRLDEVTGGYGLTAREQEILRLILQGARNKDIERKLFISGSTVRNHISNIYQKLDVGSRLELINRLGRDAQKKD